MPLGDSAVEIGRVLRTRGIGGELVVHSDSDEPRSLLRARRVLLDADPGVIPYLVLEAQPLGSSSAGVRVGLRLKGIDTRERAEAWIGAAVRIEPDDLAPLPEGELYWRDVIGLRCRTRDGRDLGVVEEIWPTPVCDQLLIHGSDGRWFLPAREDVLVKVDPESGTLWVDLPPELIGGSEGER